MTICSNRNAFSAWHLPHYKRRRSSTSTRKTKTNEKESHITIFCRSLSRACTHFETIWLLHHHPSYHFPNSIEIFIRKSVCLDSFLVSLWPCSAIWPVRITLGCAIVSFCVRHFDNDAIMMRSVPYNEGKNGSKPHCDMHLCHLNYSNSIMSSTIVCITNHCRLTRLHFARVKLH